jgi:hypothetical protein
MKPIPEFSDEDAECVFWAEADSTDFVDWSKATRQVFPRLKVSGADSPVGTCE